jgi:hypothetical protein
MTEPELFRAYRNADPNVVIDKQRCGYPACRNEAQIDSIFCAGCELVLLRKLE